MGNPNCPVSVCNAKFIWEGIKEEMDVSDGKQGEDNSNNGWKIGVPALPPMKDINVSANNNDGNKDDKDRNAYWHRKWGLMQVKHPIGFYSSHGWGECLSRCIYCRSICPYSKESRYTAGSAQLSNFSDFMQFMLICDEMEVTEQRHHEEHKDTDDQCWREQEEAEDRYRHECNEAE